MDILDQLEKKDKELIQCYAIIQLQIDKIEKLTQLVSHLEQLMLHNATILEINNKE